MRNKNFWILLIMLLTGIVLGGFMGQLAEGVSWLSWLNFGQSFGLDSPPCGQFRNTGRHLWPDHQDHNGQHHRSRSGSDHLPLDLNSGKETISLNNVLGEVRS